MTGAGDAAADPAALAVRPSPRDGGAAGEVERPALRMLEPDASDIGECLRPTLAPCPFCGRRPTTACGVNDRTGIYVAKVLCSDCFATMSASSRDQAEARERVKARWNDQRATAAESRAEVAGRRLRRVIRIARGWRGLAHGWKREARTYEAMCERLGWLAHVNGDPDETWQSRAEAAERRLGEAVGVLAPFARYAAQHPYLDGAEGKIGEFYGPAFRVSISYAALRAARDFAAQLGAAAREGGGCRAAVDTPTDETTPRSEDGHGRG